MKPNSIMLETTYYVGDDIITIKQSTFEDAPIDITFITSKIVKGDNITISFDNMNEVREILNNAETLFKTVVSKSKKL